MQFKKATLLSESINLDDAIPIPETVPTDTLVTNAPENDGNIDSNPNEEDQFLPTTSISLPTLPRATSINGQSSDEMDINTIKSEVCESSADPNYNFSIKFQYGHIHQLCNDLLLTDTSQCNVMVQSKDLSKKSKKDKKESNENENMFGVVLMDWKQWILSLLEDRSDGDHDSKSGDSNVSNVFNVVLPIIDPENDTLKKGEINLEMNFFSQKEDAMEPVVDIKKCLPSTFSLLTIHGHSLRSIPTEWQCKPEDPSQHSMAVTFEVNCGEQYAERIQIDRVLVEDESSQSTKGLLDEKLMFFVDDHALNHYLDCARKRDCFEIKVE